MLKKIHAFLAPSEPPSVDRGYELNVARAKRQMESALRAAGHSRKNAMTMTAKHFAKHLQGKP